MGAMLSRWLSSLTYPFTVAKSWCLRQIFFYSARSFVYKPLDLSSASTSIRLLTILPLQDDGIMRCEIHHTTLEDTSDSTAQQGYTALSYEWGPPSKVSILLNDHRFYIRLNLYAFLVAFLETTQDVGGNYLWIDAVCIDQKNTLEKNYSVAQMKRIYENARNVLVWTGQASHNSDYFFEQVPSGSIIPLYQLDPQSKIVLAYKHFSARSYWTRRWIVQEILAAKPQDVILMCGTSFCSWGAWSSYVSGEVGGFPEFQSCGALTMIALQGARQKEDTNEDGFWPTRCLQSLLIHLDASQCERQHDKVFSLCGLADESAPLEIDYNRPLDAVLLDILTVEKHTTPLHMFWLLFDTLAQDPGQILGRMLDVVMIGENSRWTYLSQYIHQKAPDVERHFSQEKSDLKPDWAWLAAHVTYACVHIHKCTCMSCSMISPFSKAPAVSSGHLSTYAEMKELDGNEYGLPVIKAQVYLLYRRSTGSHTEEEYLYLCTAVLLNTGDTESPCQVCLYNDPVFTGHNFTDDSMANLTMLGFLCLMAHSLVKPLHEELDLQLKLMSEAAGGDPPHPQSLQDVKRLQRIARLKNSDYGAAQRTEYLQSMQIAGRG